MNKITSTKGKGILALLLICIITGLTGISVFSGSADISVSETYCAIMHKFFPDQYEPNFLADTCVWYLRIPHTIGAILAGAGFAVAGIVLQGTFRNPAVSPFTLGIQSAAAFGSVLGIMLNSIIEKAFGLEEYPVEFNLVIPIVISIILSLSISLFFFKYIKKGASREEEVKNQGPGIKEITDKNFSTDEYTSVYSLVSLRTGNVWSPLENIWYHSFGVNGTGEVRLVSVLPSKAKEWGCFKHYVTIKEIYNKEIFHFLEDINNPDDRKVWCSSDKLPQIKSDYSSDDLTCVASYPPENSVWNIINPGNWPSDGGFFYRWRVIMEKNQTIMFDVNVKFENIEDARNIDEINHYWRVVLTSPPNPQNLSVAQMKEYGIDGYEAIHYISFDNDTSPLLTCSYFHNSGIILLKEEFINAMADE